MKTIPGELIKVKEVEGSLDSITDAANKLKSCSDESVSAIKSAVEEIKLNYKSSNRDAVISRFSSCTSEYNSISNALTGTLKGIISSLRSLISLIGELEKINESIGKLESEKQRRIDSAKDDEKVDTSDLDSQISALEADFESKKNAALSSLNQIKAMDASV